MQPARRDSGDDARLRPPQEPAALDGIMLLGQDEKGEHVSPWLRPMAPFGVRPANLLNVLTLAELPGILARYAHERVLGSRRSSATRISACRRTCCTRKVPDQGQ